MNKYKSDIADSAANMMQLPDTLEGMLQDIHGQKEVESPVTVSNESVPEPVPAATKKPQKQKQNKMNTTPDSTIPLIDGDELNKQSTLIVPRYHFNVGDLVLLRIDTKEIQLRLELNLLSTDEIEQYQIVRLTN